MPCRFVASIVVVVSQPFSDSILHYLALAFVTVAWPERREREWRTVTQARKRRRAVTPSRSWTGSKHTERWFDKQTTVKKGSSRRGENAADDIGRALEKRECARQATVAVK